MFRQPSERPLGSPTMKAISGMNRNPYWFNRIRRPLRAHAIVRLLQFLDQPRLSERLYITLRRIS